MGKSIPEPIAIIYAKYVPFKSNRTIILWYVFCIYNVQCDSTWYQLAGKPLNGQGFSRRGSDTIIYRWEVKDIKNFLSRRMGVGRYPDKTIAELFSCNRPYFDQILHKNAKFRQDYALAFQQWADSQKDNGTLNFNRILIAVELMGEDRIQALFSKLVKVLNEEWPARKLPDDLDYKVALYGGLERLEVYGPQQRQISLFWNRVAVPELWQE